MAFRWRKSFTLFPGFRVNLGKSGISTSLGPHGASVNVGPNGSHVNVGLPGTGLSQRVKIGGTGGMVSPQAFDKSHEAVKPPRFPWFSKGVAILLLLAWGCIWAYQQPNKPGEKPFELRALLISLAVFVGGAALWQWIRYRAHLESVADGSYGQPSFLSRLFSGPAVFTGEKGGRYTIGNKGQKVYKKR